LFAEHRNEKSTRALRARLAGAALLAIACGQSVRPKPHAVSDGGAPIAGQGGGGASGTGNAGTAGNSAGMAGLGGVSISVEPICDAHTNPELRAAIATALGVDVHATFETSALERVTQLVLVGASSVEGFQCLTGLLRLQLSKSSARDYSALAGLSKLTELSVQGSSEPDLTTLTMEPRALVSSLLRLDLVDDNMTMLGGLGELTSLETLNLSNNQLAALDEVAKLPKLRELSVNGNVLFDLGPLAELQTLEYVNLEGNVVSDLGPLDGLANLARVSVGRNALVALPPLSLPKLGVLNAPANEITGLPDMSGMKALTVLDLHTNALESITGIEALTELTDLVLDENALSDLGALSGLAKLRRIGALDTSVSDITSLRGLTEVIELGLRGSPVHDITPLLGWPDPPANSCRRLTVSEDALDATSLDALPTLCAHGFQITGQFDALCTHSECNPL